MINVLAHVLGLDNAAGGWYLFWSGFGSDLTELILLAAAIKGFFVLRTQRLLHHKQLMNKLDSHV